MRFFGVILAACAWHFTASGPTRAYADEFPYTAYVTADDVHVRSGPGKNYYPTDRLSKGAEVEVYRHDPGGWYAIRPPAGSFCWVEAEALEPIGDGIAEVVKDRTPCFVGTRFSGARDVHQVRLEKGEKVEVLDVKQFGDGHTGQTWCHIAPPSGEFRWVFGKFVSRELDPGISHPVRKEFLESEGESIQADRNDVAVRPASDSGWRLKGSTSFDDSHRRSLDEAPSGGRRERKTKSTSNAAADLGPTAVELDPFQAELNEIDLAVSKIASDDPATWEFTALRRRAEATVDRAQTALERGRARLVLNRIARFEDVKRRYELLNQPGADAAIAVNRPPSLPVDEPHRYDSIGKLMPVVSQRPGAPRFALVDSNNQVVSFVTPSPGTNLQALVGRQVGVSGQRGYMPELKKPHVTAMRIDVVDGAIVR